MTPATWTRIRIDVAGSDSDSDDADDCALTAPGGHSAGSSQRSATALARTSTASQPVLVNADALAWRSGEILDAVDEIRDVTNAMDSIDTPSN